MAKILVVEDDADVSLLVRELLEAEGHETVVAWDGLAGLLKVAVNRPDLAVIDIMMPDVDGLRVLEQLAEDGGGEVQLPVIVITGSPEGAAASRRILGRENVFVKPFEAPALLTRVAQLLEEDA